MPELMPDGTLSLIRRMQRWIDNFQINVGNNLRISASKSPDRYSAMILGPDVRGGGVGGRPGFFPVLVVWSAGSDGDASNYATWTYNIYALSDTSHATALTASAVQPDNSPARIVKGQVTKATADSIGQAYYKADGTVGLYSCCEKHGIGACET